MSRVHMSNGYFVKSLTTEVVPTQELEQAVASEMKDVDKSLSEVIKKEDSKAREEKNAKIRAAKAAKAAKVSKETAKEPVKEESKPAPHSGKMSKEEEEAKYVYRTDHNKDQKEPSSE